MWSESEKTSINILAISINSLSYRVVPTNEVPKQSRVISTDG